ncbi:MarR family winged helix-turn-helix transcriptional regulator [Kiloniella majae]|uniref:MarR family winged helix-turn-helix transcriptional regulator n=1 Tax=Kiloniella majae TaxID=1938558 RepID=UPI000A27726B|nr:MarR family winged helix-turn-helix transcriptional regulator [Kiloniella majae]
MPLNPTDVTSCTCAGLRKATRLISQNYDATLKPSGLKATQYTLLATVHKTGALPMKQLASVLGMDRTTLTRNLKPMIHKGFIQNEADTDQRIRLVRITKEGTRTLHEATPLWQVAQNRAIEVLGQKNWNSLMLVINKISSEEE